MQEIDVYRVAKMMIDQHGDRALLEVLHKVDQLTAKDDKAGVATWHKISDAIHWMQNEKVSEQCH